MTCFKKVTHICIIIRADRNNREPVLDPVTMAELVDEVEALVAELNAMAVNGPLEHMDRFRDECESEGLSITEIKFTKKKVSSSIF
jgi:hypothetical protein